MRTEKQLAQRRAQAKRYREKYAAAIAWRANLKKRKRTKQTPAQSRDSVKKYVENNPEKRKAHKAVYYAKKTGRIFQKPCEGCGDENSQAHHEDYNKPLEVVWLCRKCHNQTHTHSR